MSKKMHEKVKPLQWLIGTWKSTNARVFYPTMKRPVDYEEKLSFISEDKPFLNYTSTTWNPEDNSPMHCEAGFLHIDEDGRFVSLLTAQNFGISTVEEGAVEKNSLKTHSKTISSTKFAKGQVVALQRCYCLNEKGQLSYTLHMATSNTPLTLHMECLYNKEGDT